MLREGMILRARPSERWADRMARVGYVTKGLVFLLVGGLAITAAAGLGGMATDPSGALVAVARGPVSRATLGLVALGLIAHAAFRAGLAFVGEPYVKRGRLWRVVRRITNGSLSTLDLMSGWRSSVAGALAVGWGAHAMQMDSDAETQDFSARIRYRPSADRC